MAKKLSNLNKYKKKKFSYSHKKKADKNIEKKEKIEDSENVDIDELDNEFVDKLESENIIEKEELAENKNETKENQNSDNFLYFINKYSIYIFPLIILIVTIFSYSTAINNDFVNWDDDRYVTGNTHLEFSWENIKYYFSDFYFVMYIPLTMMSYMFDYHVAGLDMPEFFHLHSVVLHIINSLLVFFVVAKLFSKIDLKNSKIYGLISALLFATNPLHIASVSWIAERKDVLFTMYFLASLLVYLFYIDKKKLKLYFLALFLFLLSLLSKSQAVVLPIVLILVDYVISRIDLSKEGISSFFAKANFFKQRTINEKIPFFSLSLIFGVLAIIASGTSEPFAETISDPNKISTSTASYSLFETLIFMNYSFVEYINKLIIPQKLSVIHPYPTTPGANMPLHFYFYPVVVLGVIALLIYSFIKKWKVLVFSILFFISNIILVLSVKNFIISEHYTYIPSIAINILFAYLYFSIIKKNNKLKIILNMVLIAYILFLSIFTFQRNNIFDNSLTFWDDVIKKHDNIYISYFNRGNYYQRLGDEQADNPDQAKDLYQKAIADYDSTINLHQQNIGAYSNRGVTKAKLGDAKGAILDFNQVVKIDSTYKNVYTNLGNANAMLERWKVAIKNYDKTLFLQSDITEAYFGRGNAKKSSGDFNGAIADFNKTLELDSTNNQVYFNRAFSYFSIKDYDNALIDFNTELKYSPDFFVCYYYRAKIYEAQNKTEEAKKEFQILAQNYPQIIPELIKHADAYEQQGDNNRDISYYNQALEALDDVLKIDVNTSMAYSRKGVINGKLGDLGLAIQLLDKAIEVDSLNAKAYADRGYAFYLTNNYTKAEQDYNKAIQININDNISYFNLGVLHDKQGKYEQAIMDYNKTIKLTPKASYAYINRGIIYLKLKRKEEACQDFNTAAQFGSEKAKKHIENYCN